MDFKRFEVITFDCYGTLIDWEKGILMAAKPLFETHRIPFREEEILESYAEIEARIEAGPYLPYREVLRQTGRGLLTRMGTVPTPTEEACFLRSLNDWPPFPDTVVALRTLKQRYRLGVISNVDEDLFALTAQHLGIRFDWVITAEACRSYKPSLDNFRTALSRIGLPREKILHAAQSIYHDIIPARAVGLFTVWVDRRKGKKGHGATPPASGKADMQVPDLTTLASILAGEGMDRG